MKKLVCYTVEGLLRQGPHQVWITLGAYPTAEQAKTAVADADITSISETRILPYFRSGEPVFQPHLRRASRTAPSGVSGASANPVVVA